MNSDLRDEPPFAHMVLDPEDERIALAIAGGQCHVGGDHIEDPDDHDKDGKDASRDHAFMMQPVSSAQIIDPLYPG